MNSYKRVEKRGPKKIKYLFLFLLIFLALTNYETAQHKNDYTRGYENGERQGYGEGYQRGKREWYAIGKREGKEVGYKKGKKEGKEEAYEAYRKGINASYDSGFKAGEKKGYWKGAKAFIGKTIIPTLGFIILFLGIVFIFLTAFLLLKKRIKPWLESAVETMENFIFTIKMERLLKEQAKINKNNPIK